MFNWVKKASEPEPPAPPVGFVSAFQPEPENNWERPADAGFGRLETGDHRLATEGSLVATGGTASQRSETVVPADTAGGPDSLSPEAVQRGALMRRMAASFGDIVGLMLQAPQFKHMSLTDLEWLVLPGLATGQFMVMEAVDRSTGATGPLAAALWARVSEEIEQRMVEGAVAGRPFRLAPAD
jgi:RTX toxin acyltransferase family